MMSSRSILLPLPNGNGSVCRRCLAQLHRSSPSRLPSLPTVTYSSYATASKTRRRARPIARNIVNNDQTQATRSARVSAIQDPSSNGTDREEKDYDVHFFEEDEHGRKELQDETEFSQSLFQMEPNNDMQSFFGVMERNAKGADEKSALKDVLQDLQINWDEVKTEEDAKRAHSKMEAYERRIDAEIRAIGAKLPSSVTEQVDEMLPRYLDADKIPTSMSTSSIPVPEISEVPWSANQRRKIARLNSVLKRAAIDLQRQPRITNKMVITVYKAYHSARLPLAQGWNHVPVNVWDFLWNIFAAEEAVNPNRLSHIAGLSRDMSEAKVTFNPAQQLLTIEAVFLDGWELKAIENWKRCMGVLGVDSAETFQDFWKLGVKMYCRIGDLDQAQKGVTKLLAHGADPRVMMPLICSYAEKTTDSDRETSWNLYRSMRERLGPEMKLKDYDQVVSYFLTTHQVDNALYAFVDMMSDGEIDLKKQKYMPSVVANKFFLGKWLKRLIGTGDLDGAYSVLEYMRGKGVEAASIHLNGLIGAWKRTGGAEDLQKAMNLAWAMIDSRISFVQAREGKTGQGVMEAAVRSQIVPWPRATLETFSIVAESYRLRNRHEQLQELWNAFRQAKISPDAFIMNQLLESYIQEGKWKQAIELYQSLVTESNVIADPYTFNALWKTLGVNRLHLVSAADYRREVTASRVLFAEMMKSKSVFQGEMDGQLARKILHTFRRLKDNAGFLVALRTLKEDFHFNFSETLALEMVLGTTKLAWDTPSQRRRLMLAKKDLDRGISDAASATGDAESSSGEQRSSALYKYLWEKFWASAVDGENKSAAIAEIARQMGVPGKA